MNWDFWFSRMRREYAIPSEEKIGEGASLRGTVLIWLGKCWIWDTMDYISADI